MQEKTLSLYFLHKNHENFAKTLHRRIVQKLYINYYVINSNVVLKTGTELVPI